MKIIGYETNPKNLSNFEVEKMYEIMEKHYDNIKYEKFKNDLLDKDIIFLLNDEKNILKGFTTLEFMELNIDNVNIKGIFSGDTIVDKDVGFELELQKMWVKFIYNHLKENENIKLYWFLICKGYKTYSFLPLYFKNYYPNHEIETPIFEQKIMDEYAFIKYGEKYNKETGIIYNDGSNDYLKNNVAPVTERKLKKPIVKYFVNKNPGHENGDELVCLAEFKHSNLKKVFERMLL